MIRTEEDAKSKLCPMSLVYGGMVGKTLASNCVGSNCMAWEPVTPMIDKFAIPDGTITPEWPGDGWTLGSDNGRPCWIKVLENRGYCGLIKTA